MLMSAAIDLVLPCYNPAKDWASIILANYQALRAALPDYRLRLFLVNDGSKQVLDEAEIQALSQQIPDFQYIHYEPNRGKGYALRQGVQACDSAYTIYTDVDFPYTSASFLSIVHALEAGEDVVVGLRNQGYYAQAPLVRRWISKLLRFLIRLFLRIPITDTQGGLKGFSARGREVFLRTSIDRYLFDLEFVFLAAREKGLRLSGIEVNLRPDIIFSRMNWRILLQEGRSFMGLFFRSWF